MGDTVVEDIFNSFAIHQIPGKFSEVSSVFPVETWIEELNYNNFDQNRVYSSCLKILYCGKNYNFLN